MYLRRFFNVFFTHKIFINHESFYLVCALITGRNEVLDKVIFFTTVCHSFCSQGVGMYPSMPCRSVLGGGGVYPSMPCKSVLGGPPIFFGGVSNLGVSNFLGGLPIFQGGVLQFFWGEGAGGSPIFRDTVNVRPVRILLECILVSLSYYSDFNNNGILVSFYCLKHYNILKSKKKIFKKKSFVPLPLLGNSATKCT